MGIGYEEIGGNWVSGSESLHRGGDRHGHVEAGESNSVVAALNDVIGDVFSAWLPLSFHCDQKSYCPNPFSSELIGSWLLQVRPSYYEVLCFSKSYKQIENL